MSVRTAKRNNTERKIQPAAKAGLEIISINDYEIETFIIYLKDLSG
jgi:hypothetical protein